MSAVNKFWLRMGEKFGKRWIDERGMKPNGEWAALIGRYTEKIVMDAIEELPLAMRTHPPTEPEMASHLRRFASKNPEFTDERNYWWHMVINTLVQDGFLQGLWSMGTSIYELNEPERSRMRTTARKIFDSIIPRISTHTEKVLCEEIKKESWAAVQALRSNVDDPTSDRHP